MFEKYWRNVDIYKWQAKVVIPKTNKVDRMEAHLVRYLVEFDDGYLGHPKTEQFTEEKDVVYYLSSFDHNKRNYHWFTKFEQTTLDMKIQMEIGKNARRT